eukprot:3458111-Rhodomonas_salina.2
MAPRSASSSSLVAAGGREGEEGRREGRGEGRGERGQKHNRKRERSARVRERERGRESKSKSKRESARERGEGDVKRARFSRRRVGMCVVASLHAHSPSSLNLSPCPRTPPHLLLLLLLLRDTHEAKRRGEEREGTRACAGGGGGGEASRASLAPAPRPQAPAPSSSQPDTGGEVGIERGKLALREREVGLERNRGGGSASGSHQAEVRGLGNEDCVAVSV